MSGSNCCFLTCTHVSQEAGKVAWYSHLLKNFPLFVVIHIVKDFNIVNEADAFLEFSCFFYDPTDVGNLISGSSVFSKSSLYFWKFMYYWSLVWRILSITLLACKMSTIMQQFEHSLALPFFGIWNENWPFPVLFSEFACISSAALSQHHLLRFEIVLFHLKQTF